jgi:hypothetical protein
MRRKPVSAAFASGSRNTMRNTLKHVAREACNTGPLLRRGGARVAASLPRVERSARNDGWGTHRARVVSDTPSARVAYAPAALGDLS